MGSFVEIERARVPVGDHSTPGKLLKSIKKNAGLKLCTRSEGGLLVLQHEGEDLRAENGQPIRIADGKLNARETELILKSVKAWHENR